MNINHKSISQFCAELGQDRLLVQGAGGNVSWKDGDTLWIKGSGTWLANATNSDIFVPVAFRKNIISFSRGDFSVPLEVANASNLRPSIEAFMHVILPHKIVIHLHAINALALLTLQDAKTKIDEVIKNFPRISTFIEYFKPGVELAKAINDRLISQHDIQIIFLKNHGIVIGGNSINEVNSILKTISSTCESKISLDVINFSAKIPDVPLLAKTHYKIHEDIEIQQLAQNPSFFQYIRSDWVLYPDHAVFLGPKSFSYSNWDEFFIQNHRNQFIPELIFIENEGVFTTHDFSLTKTVQLKCYYDVLSRISKGTKLDPLKESDVLALLNWDAEKLRQKVSP